MTKLQSVLTRDVPVKLSNKSMMRRSARVFLGHVNAKKTQVLVEFLALCHDATQYFIDLLWQRKDAGKGFADLETVHRACDRFKITTRIGQALAKQAKESIAAVREAGGKKPLLRRHVVTLFYHFVTVEPFRGNGFDWAVRFTGSGAPRLTVPIKSTKVINQFLADAWRFSKTIRLGRRRGSRLFIDLLLEKPRPPEKTEGSTIGMDSNYKAGFVFSDGQVVGQELYPRIQTFARRQRNTHAEIASMLGRALKRLGMSSIRVLCVEDLKRVKEGARRSRQFNRRLSHWLYRLCLQVLGRLCEESGVRLESKDPWKTSQFCRHCSKWDRRNRRGDSFLCVHCGHSDQADANASKNLEYLGLTGKYGLRTA